MVATRRSFVLGGAAGLAAVLGGAGPAVGAVGSHNPFRPVRGGPDLLRVHLPQRLAVVQPFTDMSLLVRTREPVQNVVVRLHNQKGTSPLSAVDEIDSRTPRTETTVRLAFTDFQWAHWGWHEWRAWVSRTMPDGATERSVRGQAVEVRPGSTLVTRAARSGDAVTVTGEALVYTTTTRRFVPFAGRPVLVEVPVGDGWEQLGGATTDERGRFRLAVRSRGPLRLRCTSVGLLSGWGAVGEVLEA